MLLFFTRRWHDDGFSHSCTGNTLVEGCRIATFIGFASEENKLDKSAGACFIYDSSQRSEGKGDV